MKKTGYYAALPIKLLLSHLVEIKELAQKAWKEIAVEAITNPDSEDYDEMYANYMYYHGVKEELEKELIIRARDLPIDKRCKIVLFYTLDYLNSDIKDIKDIIQYMDENE